MVGVAVKKGEPIEAISERKNTSQP